MKRADPDPRAGQEPRNALGHFAGRFVCEGDRQHTGRIDPLFDNAGDAAGNDAGFSGTGAGQNEQGAFRLFDGPPLAGGQIVRGVALSTTLKTPAPSRADEPRENSVEIIIRTQFATESRPRVRIYGDSRRGVSEDGSNAEVSELHKNSGRIRLCG